ncbi:ankyrin repeat domain-containing protein [Microbacterium indicum]|uniref:ankyrin repeat domain-containing protein n=1 Tax=Microbacterium indicum TaxID=358100 RepID=UPI00040BD4E4|nr:ankyrin repeat domain-containing protein [Microbacterium indicum]
MPESMPDDVVEFANRLFDLARAGDESLLAYLDQGVDADLTDAKGDTLLMLAAYNGHAALVAGLLAAGADPNRLNDRGQSPVAGAVFKGAEDVVAALVAAGADLDAGAPSARATAQMFGRALPA